MNEALCSILSGEGEWCYHTEGRFIKFNRDGTGELWCRCNFNYWIAADIEWESIKPPRNPSQIAGIPSQTWSAAQNKGPQLLGRLDLEITLLKRLPKGAESSNLSKSTGANECSLTDDAFRPKSFTITIERGNFIEPSHVGYPSSNSSRFAFRLLFDKSPYPPRSEWRRPEDGPDDSQFWNHVEFVGRISPDLEKQGKAMNQESAGWSECAVS
ncbi:hypothetical protein F4781DRAFT_20980 [Annulohypoxylon bovei var. microspora]|nr:hypothetical protein F4781DRAFT_20980 [Annulohypoxylon bovei var. microspora]